MDQAEIDRVLTDPERLAALEDAHLLDDPPAEALGRLTRLALRLLDVPAAFVTLAGAEEEHFAAARGLDPEGEPPRTAPVDESFCRHAIATREPLVIPDAREDDRVRESPLIGELGIVAYLGVPLITSGGHALGAFCVSAPEPRDWTDDDLEIVRDLAAAATAELAARVESARRSKVEEALRRREAWFRGVLENVGDVIAVLDDAGRFVFTTPSAERVLGWERGELKGDPALEHIHPGDRDRIAEALAEIGAGGGRVRTEEYRFRHADGGWRVLEATGHALPESADFGGIVVTARDVTEQHRYRERLEEAVAERTRDLERARREVLERLARAAEYRDDETGEHTRRVGRLTARLARALDLAEDEATLLREVAPLHDLGKIGIPDAILLKEGPLTDDEFEVMKRHTVIGAELLAGGSSDLARTAETIARSHHERWDGRGYPRGLEGEAIPLYGRMVAVVDAFDAMTHERPYKPAWPVEEVLEEIRGCAGGQFDPEVVEAFLAIRDEAAALVEGGGEG